MEVSVAVVVEVMEEAAEDIAAAEAEVVEDTVVEEVVVVGVVGVEASAQVLKSESSGLSLDVWKQKFANMISEMRTPLKGTPRWIHRSRASRMAT